MISLHQTEWFGIRFSELGVPLSDKMIASSQFYDAFYTHFYQKFQNYGQLPSSYKASKGEVAKHLCEMIDGAKNVLSIGSGNGIVEQELALYCKGKLVALEPSENASRWLRMNSKIESVAGYFPQDVPEGFQPEFAYIVALDYVFDDSQYLKLLEDVRDSGIQHFVMHNLTVYQPEFWAGVRHMTKLLLARLGLYDLGQFWGWSRTIREHIALFNAAGFEEITFGERMPGLWWISGKTKE